jgi:hypothetical protein
VRVGRRDLNESDVDAHPARQDETRNIREEHRHEIGATLVHRLAHVVADEKSGVPEPALETGLYVRSRPQGEQMDDLVVREVIPRLHHGLYEHARLSRA